MVHALEQIHRIVGPDGLLIDIHPLPEPPAFEIVRGGEVVWRASDRQPYVSDVRAAERALERMTRRGLFAVERSAEFDFITHGASVAEIRAFWEVAGAYYEPPDPDALAARTTRLDVKVDRALREAGRGARVVYHERARITRLKPLPG